jgi:hypothetical protein
MATRIALVSCVKTKRKSDFTVMAVISSAYLKFG